MASACAGSSTWWQISGLYNAGSSCFLCKYDVCSSEFSSRNSCAPQSIGTYQGRSIGKLTYGLQPNLSKFANLQVGIFKNKVYAPFGGVLNSRVLYFVRRLQTTSHPVGSLQVIYVSQESGFERFNSSSICISLSGAPSHLQESQCKQLIHRSAVFARKEFWHSRHTGCNS